MHCNYHTYINSIKKRNSIAIIIVIIFIIILGVIVIRSLKEAMNWACSRPRSPSDQNFGFTTIFFSFCLLNELHTEDQWQKVFSFTEIFPQHMQCISSDF